MALDTLLRGYKEIGEWLGVAPRTALRYRADMGMPVVRLPSNVPCTTPALLLAWMEKMEQERVKRIGQKRKPRNLKPVAQKHEIPVHVKLAKYDKGRRR